MHVDRQTPRCEIIAEAGVNHNGDLKLARRLVEEAADAGADAVKFQTFRSEEVVTPGSERTEYQKRAGTTGQHEMLSKLELSKEEHERLYTYCQDHDIEFLSTPYDPESVELLASLGVERYKIASADIVNKPLLEAVANTGRPVVLSTGMATLDEIERAVQFLQENGCPSLTVLHCVSCYPADPTDLNLQFMSTISQALDVPIGFSDHTLGTAMPVVATGLGATMVEKHLTLDRSMEGPDHAASLEPHEFDQMVTDIRAAAAAVGDGSAGCAECELANRAAMRRSLHARTDIAAGEVLTESDLLIARPAAGISPWEIDSVLGRTVTTEIPAHEPLTWQDLR